MKLKDSFFPPPDTADETGMVALTKGLHAELLIDAFMHGIFPWSEKPVAWYSPNPRAIFLRDRIHLPRRLPRIMRKNAFTVTFDQAFTDVMRACAAAHSNEGEWISSGFIQAYTDLHAMGHAHSVEVWKDGQLAGGLYGVQIRGLFSGESMFYCVSNASKVAFAFLIRWLHRIGSVLLDAQVLNHHTARLGAVLIHRDDYLYLLQHALKIRSRLDGRKWPRNPPELAT